MLVNRQDLIKYYTYELKNAFSTREYKSIRRLMRLELDSKEIKEVYKKIESKKARI